MINHGEWEAYTPKTIPEDKPSNALFARRKNDGVDWYDYVKSEPFRGDTVKITARWIEPLGSYLVGAATRDGARLFPPGFIVVEIDSGSENPQADFGNRLYDAKTGKFGDRPKPEIPPTPTETRILSALDDIVKRLKALECKE